eukprot:scaffold976_cov122-Isochrysis_galbana.AAC.1
MQDRHGVDQAPARLVRLIRPPTAAAGVVESESRHPGRAASFAAPRRRVAPREGSLGCTSQPSLMSRVERGCGSISCLVGPSWPRRQRPTAQSYSHSAGIRPLRARAHTPHTHALVRTRKPAHPPAPSRRGPPPIHSRNERIHSQPPLTKSPSQLPFTATHTDLHRTTRPLHATPDAPLPCHAPCTRPARTPSLRCTATVFPQLTEELQPYTP